MARHSLGPITVIEKEQSQISLTTSPSGRSERWAAIGLLLVIEVLLVSLFAAVPLAQGTLSLFVVVIGLLIFLTLVSPSFQSLVIDKHAGRIRYNRQNLLPFLGSPAELNLPLAGVTAVSSLRRFSNEVFTVTFVTGEQFELTVPQSRVLEVAAELNALPRHLPIEPMGKTGLPAPMPENYATMVNEINSWRKSSLLLGALHLIAGGFLSPSFGLTLLLVGLLSWKVQEAVMFILYAITLLWVGLSNLGSGGSWLFFGLYQTYLGMKVYRTYKLYRASEADFLANQPAHSFPSWGRLYLPALSASAGVVGLLGFIALFLVLLILAIAGRAVEPPLFLKILLETMISIGTIGFATGIGGLLSDYPRRQLNWVGTISGGLLLAINLSFIVLAMFSLI